MVYGNDDSGIRITINGTDYYLDENYMSDRQSLYDLQAYMAKEADTVMLEFEEASLRKLVEKEDPWVAFEFNGKTINVKRQHLAGIQSRLNSISTYAN
jgi:hypothetical protein